MDVFDNSVIEVLENTAEQLMKESVELREKDQLYSYGKFMFSEAARKAANILREAYGEGNGMDKKCFCELEWNEDDWEVNPDKYEREIFMGPGDLRFVTEPPYDDNYIHIAYYIDDVGFIINYGNEYGGVSLAPKYCPLCGRKLRKEQSLYVGTNFIYKGDYIGLADFSGAEQKAAATILKKAYQEEE